MMLTTKPAARIVAAASSASCPSTFGTTRTRGRPFATVSVIVAPGRTAVPAAGSCAVTMPGEKRRLGLDDQLDAVALLGE